MMGKTKKQCVFFVLWSWSLSFFFPNLLYKGFSIRVMVFWRFFQDVFSMFHVSLRCRRWSPFSKWTSLVRSNSAFSNPQGRLDVFSAAWVTYKKTTGTSSNFSGKKDPHETFAFFFFLPWFIYIPLKKRQLGFKWPSYEKREAVSFRFPDFVDFSQGDRPSSHRNARREEGLAWEVPSS